MNVIHVQCFHVFFLLSIVFASERNHLSQMSVIFGILSILFQYIGVEFTNTLPHSKYHNSIRLLENMKPQIS